MHSPAMTFGLAALLALMVGGCDSDDEPSGGAGASGSGGQGGSGGQAGSGGQGSARTNFFVTSDKSTTGNLGGLTGADARCQALADAAGLGSKTWRAYLSVESDPNNAGAATHARDRIGTGPWYNAKDTLLANDLAALHSRTGDAELFLDERGQKINGQWAGSPAPNEHDILTGSTGDGMAMAGMTCANWTSAEAGVAAQVGHSDGLGPGANADPPFSSWNSSHVNQSCSDTAPRGGAGRIYCFAIN